MPTSEINAYTTPEGTAKAATHEDLRNLVKQMMQGDVMRFASTSERTTVFDALKVSPPKGAVSYLQDVKAYESYNGTAWATLASLAAWTSWTPTLTNLTLGNGTVVARHLRVGQTLHYRFKFTLGSTSAVAAGPRFSLPFAAHADYALFADKPGWASAADSGVADYDMALRLVTNNSTVEFNLLGTNGLHGEVTATAPFTWGTGDSLSAFGTIEIA